ncbi:hypothetical protein [Streptomyces sp. WMMC905]|uniref:hypothetical protein n=1 Tax=Streptomyces sp. WMMC905 TaxID=3404123 RepID=UPI003B93FB1C
MAMTATVRISEQFDQELTEQSQGVSPQHAFPVTLAHAAVAVSIVTAHVVLATVTMAVG